MTKRRTKESESKNEAKQKETKVEFFVSLAEVGRSIEARTDRQITVDNPGYVHLPIGFSIGRY